MRLFQGLCVINFYICMTQTMKHEMLGYTLWAKKKNKVVNCTLLTSITAGQWC